MVAQNHRSLAVSHNCKRSPVKLNLLLGLVLFLYFVRTRQRVAVLSNNNNATSSDRVRIERATKAPQSPPNLKYILYYNRYWLSRDFQFGEGRQPFIDFGCHINECYATSNRSELETLSDFDAVLFHVHQPRTMPTQYPLWRQPHQYFVMMNMESPSLDLNSYDGLYAGFFNATMTYRSDSDFPRPYGWFMEKENDDRQVEYADWSLPRNSSSPPRNWIPYDEQKFFKSLPQRDTSFLALADRPKKVAWVVSHCTTPSLREDYVEELQKYISVDIFGLCGDLPCDQRYRSNMSGSCTAAVQRDYKFYLGFENAFCNEYVTEKFFERVENHVVIVLGQANYSHVVAPPHSFINVMDYDNPQHLANYLHKLDRNRSEYLSYFWWKDYYKVLVPSKKFFAPSMCRLCERLHAEDRHFVYHDMDQWWRGNAQCDQLMRIWKTKSPSIGAPKLVKRIARRNQSKVYLIRKKRVNRPRYKLL